MCVVLTASFVGCTTSPEAHLLEVSGLGPARVEYGDLLHVSGAGFPSGRDALLHLDGVIVRPAEGAHDVDFTLAARAVSPERVEARVSEELLTRLGGGTFRGRVVVSFRAAAAEAAPVLGVRDGLVVLFVAPTGVRLGTELVHARAATALLSFLGAQPTADAEADGVRVDHVDKDGRAAAIGLRVGDVIIESDGAMVTSLGDLAPAAGVRAVRWRVARVGESAPLTLTFSLRGLGGAPDPEWSWAAALVAFVWLFVLLRFAPTAKLVGAAHRRLCVAARVRTSRADLAAAAVAGMAAVALAAPPHLPSGVDVVSVFGLLFALRLVSASRGGADGCRARLLRALTLELAAGMALAALLIHAGTTRFAGLASAQSLAPLTLGALSGPVPLVAALLWLRVACVPEVRLLPRAPAAFDGDSARRSFAVALVTLAAFGGASSTVAGAHHVLAALVLGPVAVLLSLVAARLRELGPLPSVRTLAIGAGTLAVALGLAAVPMPLAMDALFARGCVALVFGTLLVAGVGVWRVPNAAPFRPIER